jgi:hypothetical protein
MSADEPPMTLDPDSPVTHRQLREELGKLDARIGKLDAKVDNLAAMVIEHMVAMEGRLMTELARHTNAAKEELLVAMGVVDDKHKDQPPRVERLEAAVFRPRRKKASH